MRYKVKDAYGGKEIVCELLAKRTRENGDVACWWAREDGTTFEQFMAWAKPVENIDWDAVWTTFDEGYDNEGAGIDWDKGDDWENQKRFIQMIVEARLGKVV